MVLGAWGNRDHDECLAIVHAALDAGVNFVDTADMYAFGESEEILGPGAQGPPGRRHPRHQVLQRHGRGPEPPGRRRAAGSSGPWRTACAAWTPTGSTCTRCTVRIPTTDLDETLGALSDLVHAGKIRAFGTSTFPAELLVEAQWTAAAPGPRAADHRAAAVLHPRPAASSGAVLPTCQRYGLGVLVWAPLNGGWLTGKYRDGRRRPASRAAREPDHFDFGGPVHERKMALVEERWQRWPTRRDCVWSTSRTRSCSRTGGDLGHHRAAHAGPARGRCWTVRTPACRTRCGTASDALVPPGVNAQPVRRRLRAAGRSTTPSRRRR